MKLQSERQELISFQSEKVAEGRRTFLTTARQHLKLYIVLPPGHHYQTKQEHFISIENNPGQIFIPGSHRGIR